MRFSWAPSFRLHFAWTHRAPRSARSSRSSKRVEGEENFGGRTGNLHPRAVTGMVTSARCSDKLYPTDVNTHLVKRKSAFSIFGAARLYPGMKSNEVLRLSRSPASY